MIRFRIEQPHARPEEIVVEDETALLGSAAHCDVRLPPEYARPEHVQVTRRATAVWARALSFEPPPLLNGASFGDAALGRESLLTIGALRIHVSIVGEVAATGSTPPARKSSPVILIGGCGFIAMLVALVAVDSAAKGADDDSAHAEPPALWDAAPSCPVSAKRQMAAAASEKLLLARSKRERRPFSARDGVAAVPLFETAAACFRGADDEPRAVRAADAATRLRGAIEMDYRTHQMKLDHALVVGDGASALREIDALIELTDGKTGPYVTWLSSKRRVLRVALEAAQADNDKVLGQ